MRGRKAAEAVLDAVQVLDQVFALDRHALDERGDVGARDRPFGVLRGRRIFETGMAISFMVARFGIARSRRLW